MPSVSGELIFLANIPLYEYEKPYLVLLPPSKDATIDPSIPRENLQWENHIIDITDIRGQDEFSIDRCGFQVLQHASKITTLPQIHGVSVEDVEAYKTETAALLKEKLGAVHVVCYDFRLRMNVEMVRETINLRDPLLVEGPARGAHNGMFAHHMADVTAHSGPEMIRNHLPAEDLKTYTKPGYRFQIVK
ncbi:MAG: hypothetical protein MMC33_009553 [Icmadophila ericetorum]|nr:hypothetical protein [Icmadophila ericetorum]